MLKYKNYTITFPNNKIYVGYTSTSLNERFQSHKKNSYNGHAPLYRAIQHFGWDNIKVECVASFSEQASALENEKRLIVEMKSHISENGYNNTWGGEDFPQGYNGMYWKIGKTQNEINAI